MALAVEPGLDYSRPPLGPRGKSNEAAKGPSSHPQSRDFCSVPWNPESYLPRLFTPGLGTPGESYETAMVAKGGQIAPEAMKMERAGMVDRQ